MRPAAALALVLGALLAVGALALRVEATSVAQEGGALRLSAPLHFVVERIAVPSLHLSGNPDPSPADVASRTSASLWVAMALGLLLATLSIWRIAVRRAAAPPSGAS